MRPPSSGAPTQGRLVSGLLERVFDGALDQLVHSALSLRQPTADELARLEASACRGQGRAQAARTRKNGWREAETVNAFVNAAVDFLWAEGPMLLIGGTLLLAAGAMATCCQRSPAARQRTAELTVVGVLVWLILACVPLPRYDRSRWFSLRETARPTEFKPTTVDGAVVKSASRGHAANDLDAVMAELPVELQEELSTGFPAERGGRDAEIDDDRIAEDVAAAIATGGGRSAALAPSAATGFEPVDWRQLGAIVYLLRGDQFACLVAHGPSDFVPRFASR